MYTSAEINRISGSRLAVYNRKYTESNGDIWIGTADNRLKRLYLKDVNVGVELYGSDPIVDLKTYLRSINSPKPKQTIIDFGSALYQTYKIFTIQDNDITEKTTLIEASIPYEAPPGKDLDDVEMDNITVTCGQIQQGSFQVLVRGLEGSLHDKFLLNYIIL